ncbi:hypothetical protein [Pelagibaculum spongiae]|uniref:hypothetical protein n=1 Tax=Pelagibaculum spongiae TaxID=2080658 RepID=UPI0014732716|nr:hypothetical protein [Pelagibaculum spongiae]
MSAARQPRRSRKQWQALIHSFKNSDLSALANQRLPGWNIVLSLGNGVELKLSQQ